VFGFKGYQESLKILFVGYIRGKVGNRSLPCPKGGVFQKVRVRNGVQACLEILKV
jgi:hypothetical protein